jgi:O-antigen/teichoic acid export membrane protein
VAAADARADAQARALPLRVNFAWTLAGNVTYAACQWAMLVAIAKLGTPAMVGQFALGLAIAAPVFMLTNLQLRGVQATDARREFAFGHYFALRVIGTAAALAAVVVLLVVAGYRRETALVILVVALAKAAESFSDVLYGHWQQRERLDCIARAMILRGVGALAALGVTLYLTRRIVPAVLAMAAAWLACLLLYERRTARQLSFVPPATGGFPLVSHPHSLVPVFNWPRLRQLALLALPLGLVSALASLQLNVPRYFLDCYHGAAALGYFAALLSIPLAGNNVVMSLTQAALPRLAWLCKQEPPTFVQLLLRLVFAALVLGLGGVALAAALGKSILTLLFSSDYANYSKELVWLMTFGALNYVQFFLVGGMTAARMLRPQAVLYLLATGITSVSSALLIPKWGLQGAAEALLLGSLFTCAGSAASWISLYGNNLGRRKSR